MDLYTKTVLTVIAMALSAIALQNAGVAPAFAQNAKGPVFVTICDGDGRRCGLGGEGPSLAMHAVKDGS